MKNKDQDSNNLLQVKFLRKFVFVFHKPLAKNSQIQEKLLMKNTV